MVHLEGGGPARNKCLSPGLMFLSSTDASIFSLFTLNEASTWLWWSYSNKDRKIKAMQLSGFRFWYLNKMSLWDALPPCYPSSLEDKLTCLQWSPRLSVSWLPLPHLWSPSTPSMTHLRLVPLLVLRSGILSAGSSVAPFTSPHLWPVRLLPFHANLSLLPWFLPSWLTGTSSTICIFLTSPKSMLTLIPHCDSFERWGFPGDD